MKIFFIFLFFLTNANSFLVDFDKTEQLKSIDQSLKNIDLSAFSTNYLIFMLSKMEIYILKNPDNGDCEKKHLINLDDDDYNKFFVKLIDLITLHNDDDSYLRKLENYDDFTLFRLNSFILELSGNQRTKEFKVEKNSLLDALNLHVYYDHLNKIKDSKCFYIMTVSSLNDTPNYDRLLKEFKVIINSSMHLDKIVIGYNTGGHWVTIVYDIKDKKFTWINSYEEDYANLRIKKMQEIFNSNSGELNGSNYNAISSDFKFEAIGTGHQQNEAFSCGYHVMLISWLLHRYSLDESCKVLKLIFKENEKISYIITNIINNKKMMTITEIEDSINAAQKDNNKSNPGDILRKTMQDLASNKLCVSKNNRVK